MPPEHFPCPACEKPIAFPDDGEDIATCSRCKKTWKAGPYFGEGFGMALAEGGRVEMTLWHNQIDGCLVAMLAFLVGFTKAILVVFAITLVVLFLWIGLELNWPLWIIGLISLYAVLASLDHCLRMWFPRSLAATPTAIICMWGLVRLDCQPKPVMIPWSSVIEAMLTIPGHVSVDYRNVAGGSCTIILHEKCSKTFVDLYECICAHCTHLRAN